MLKHPQIRSVLGRETVQSLLTKLFSIVLKSYKPVVKCVDFYVRTHTLSCKHVDSNETTYKEKLKVLM